MSYLAFEDDDGIVKSSCCEAFLDENPDHCPSCGVLIDYGDVKK